AAHSHSHGQMRGGAQQHTRLELHAIRDSATLGDMAARAERTGVADKSGQPLFAHAACDGYPLAHDVAAAEDQLDRLSLGRGRMWLNAEHRAGADHIVATQRGMSHDRDAAAEPRSLADAGIASHDAKRSDLDILIEL